MSCRICGRNSCMESFHSFEEQEKYEKLVEKYGEKGISHTLRYYEKLEENKL